MLGKSACLQIIPQQSTQNTANLSLQTCDKNQWTFLLHSMSVNFSSRNNFANSGSFAKVSVPVRSIIPCLNDNDVLFMASLTSFPVRTVCSISIIEFVYVQQCSNYMYVHAMFIICLGTTPSVGTNLT